MKIHLYLLCFNEATIIKHVLQYYSQFCSKIFILDNYSTDNSTEIASSFKQVSIIKWDSNQQMNEHLQSEVKTTYYKDYSRKGGQFTEEVADWVIACDMDELLYHPNLLNILKKYKEQGITVPQITGFDMSGEMDFAKQTCLTKQVKTGKRATAFDKRILFDPSFDMVYSTGAHPVGPGFERMKKQPNYKASNEFPVALLHYKNIGDRFIEKAQDYLDRQPEGQVYQKADGTFAGMSNHYANALHNPSFIENSYKDITKVIHDEGQIHFSKFEEATDDKGLVTKQSFNIDISRSEIQLLKECIVYYEKKDLELACLLMEIAYRASPSGIARWPMRQKLLEAQKNRTLPTSFVSKKLHTLKRLILRQRN